MNNGYSTLQVTDFESFIEHCENDLIEKRKLSDATMVLFQGLSESEKRGCKPVVDLVNGELVDVEITMPSNE